MKQSITLALFIFLSQILSGQEKKEKKDYLLKLLVL